MVTQLMNNLIDEPKPINRIGRKDNAKIRNQSLIWASVSYFCGYGNEDLSFPPVADSQ